MGRGTTKVVIDRNSGEKSGKDEHKEKKEGRERKLVYDAKFSHLKP